MAISTVFWRPVNLFRSRLVRAKSPHTSNWGLVQLARCKPLSDKQQTASSQARDTLLQRIKAKKVPAETLFRLPAPMFLAPSYREAIMTNFDSLTSLIECREVHKIYEALLDIGADKAWDLAAKSTGRELRLRLTDHHVVEEKTGRSEVSPGDGEPMQEMQKFLRQTYEAYVTYDRERAFVRRMRGLASEPPDQEFFTEMLNSIPRDGVVESKKKTPMGRPYWK